MTRTVLFIPTAKVENGQPSVWFQQRLDLAYQYFLNHRQDVVGIVISGYWNDITATPEQTEAEVAKNYLLNLHPELPIELDERAVETGGNFAFSKPIIARMTPERVVVFCSAVYGGRLKYFAKKIFDPAWDVQFEPLKDQFSENPRAIAKEPRALVMFRSLFDELADGDDAGARRILLEKTPFYDRSKISNEDFFNLRWPGGFADFTQSIASKHNQ